MGEMLTIRLAKEEDANKLFEYLQKTKVARCSEELVSYKLKTKQTLIALALDKKEVIGYCTASLIPTLSNVTLTAFIVELSVYDGEAADRVKESLLQFMEQLFDRLPVADMIFIPPLEQEAYGYQAYKRAMHYKKK